MDWEKVSNGISLLRRLGASLECGNLLPLC